MINIRSKLNDHLADFRASRQTVKTESICLLELEDKLSFAQDAQNILQHVAQAVQQEAHDRIAGVVSKCLETVFDEPYEFKIVFDRKRGKTEAKLLFSRNGMDVDPLTASGGGVVDVAAFALRLACLVLTRPPTRRIIVADEPFRFVSAEYRGRVRRLLETLSEEMKVQFVMVTHIDALKCGKVVEL